MKAKLRLALELERIRRNNLKELHPLRQLFWESTLRCNVACLHCGSDCTASALTPDMPKEDFLKVIDEEIVPHVNPNHVLIIISGGEPTMRKDLEEVGMALHKRGFPWGMVTNGVALTEERFRALRRAGLVSMTVSCDGAEDDHNWMRGSRFAWEGASRAIRLAAAETDLVRNGQWTMDNGQWGNVKCENSKCENDKCPDGKCSNSKCENSKCSNDKCPDDKCLNSKCPDDKCPDDKCPNGKCENDKIAQGALSFVWDVVTCVNQRNRTKLPEIREMLWSMGVRDWRIFGIDPMGRAASNPELLLNDEEFRQMLDFIRSERQAGRHVSYSCEGFLGDYEAEVRDHLYQCAAGISIASILIDGSISACTSIRGKYYQGNIYKDHFWDVWENGFRSYRDRSWMKQTTPCKDCKMWRYCEGNGMHLRREDGSLMLCHYEKTKV